MARPSRLPLRALTIENPLHPPRACAGVLDCAFDRYQPVRGTIPARPRSDHNPLDRKEYLLHVVRGVAGRWAGA